MHSFSSSGKINSLTLLFNRQQPLIFYLPSLSESLSTCPSISIPAARQKQWDDYLNGWHFTGSSLFSGLLANESRICNTILFLSALTFLRVCQLTMFFLMPNYIKHSVNIICETMLNIPAPIQHARNRGWKLVNSYKPSSMMTANSHFFFFTMMDAFLPFPFLYFPFLLKFSTIGWGI